MSKPPLQVDPLENPDSAKNPYVIAAKKYGNDPVAFAEEVIGIKPDEWQREFLQAVADPEEAPNICSLRSRRRQVDGGGDGCTLAHQFSRAEQGRHDGTDIGTAV